MSNNYDDDEEIQPMQLSNKDNIYDLMKNLEFSTNLQYQEIQLKKAETQSISGTISMKLKETRQSIRSGVDLICLIDRSGSMEGAKMEMVHHTLKQLLNFLKETDRLCLVQFDTSAQRLTPFLKVSPQNKIQFENVIDQINDGGGTDISSGTEIAFEQIKKRKYKNKVTSIFLLSDGQDGSAERKVRAQLEQLDEPFTIHSFGYGGDHDGKMMSAICSMKNGNFYFVHDISLLDEFFANTFGGLETVVGEDIEISVKLVAQAPFDGIKISKTYGMMWEKLNDLNYRIKIPQISQGNSRNFVSDLTLPIYDAQMGNLPKVVSVLDVTLELKSIQTGQIFKKQSTVNIKFLEESQQVTKVKESIQVVAQIIRVKATDTIDNAREACEKSQYEQAQVMIDNTLSDIKKKTNAAKVSQGIIQNLEQSKQAAQKENYQKYGKQQMYQIVSNNYAEGGINSNFDENGVQNQKDVIRQFQTQNQIKMVKQVKKLKNEQIQEEPYEGFTEDLQLFKHAGTVIGVDICQERKLLASGSADKTVKLWNLENNTLIKTYPYNGLVQSVVFSNQGNLLAFGGGYDYSIHIIDISDLQNDNMISKLVGNQLYINQIIFSNNSKQIISGSNDCTVSVWDFEYQKKPFKFTLESYITGVAISGDDTLLASNSKEGVIRIWNFQERKILFEQVSKQGGCCVQFSNDQKMLISSHQQGGIKLWSLEGILESEVELIKEFNVTTKYIWTILLTSCQRFILSISNQDGIIQVINSEIGDEAYRWEYEQRNYCYSVCVSFSKDMNFMAFGKDNSVSVWRKNGQIKE